jgi:phosphoglycolate phosphatase
VRGIGVFWGYHPVSALRDAAHVIEEFAALPNLISDLWRGAA